MTRTPGFLIDGHLDLAMNGLDGRDLTLPLGILRANDPVTGQTATVSFPEMREAGTRVCLGTLFAMPRTAESPQGYVDAEGARRQALAQLDQYRRWEAQGQITLLAGAQAVSAHLQQEDADVPLGVVLLMEGADPVRDADDLSFWVEAGVRIIGPAWGATRYAGGTGAPGPLTDAGKALVTAMRDLNLTVDASHLDDAAFWDVVEIGPRLIASHSNARARMARQDGQPASNRHLSDEMARAVAATGGVVGLVYLSSFIQPDWKPTDARAPLQKLADHARHYAELIGWDRVVLGTDMDGGFGQQKCPAGIDRYADVPRLLDLLPKAARAGVAGENWARWLETYL
ncbi:membrane dipeptidase [Deinococcus deserti]|uniref:Putative peptidase (Renal dipeptidase) n=1 Tax=Deinococcus deserti (strain DSM 17065 / CIP 109153 / LMG 22923 / VCD115) TaxID=546414 RepID=C1CV43_DEIDV|nr:membrane dipeptidase [Deinococcus deserti]ACO46060.1 putative peptidase (renal dipeptidase) [Deinococcus deserti VCD115]